MNTLVELHKSLDDAVREFKGYIRGENGFDELDFKEAVIQSLSHPSGLGEYTTEELEDELVERMKAESIRLSIEKFNEDLKAGRLEPKEELE